MTLRLLIVCALLTFVGGIAGAQASTDRTLVLGYTEPEPDQVVLLDSSGTSQPTVEGTIIPEGWLISTVSGGFTELQLKPEGTLIRIGSESTLRVDSLQDSKTSSTGTRLQLIRGSIRVVMPKLSTINYRGITVGTPLATFGSRGADFTVFVDSEHNSDLVYVTRDTVDLVNNTDGRIIQIVGGMAANAAGMVFEVSAVDPVLRSRYNSELQFRKFDVHEYDELAK